MKKIFVLLFILFLNGAALLQAQKFNLTFQDNNTGTWFYDATPVTSTPLISSSMATWHNNAGRTTVGAVRRWIASEVFAYIENAIVVNKDAKLQITFYAYSDINQDVLGEAMQFINPNDANTHAIINTMPFNHIMSGIDPNGTVPDARIEINFARAFDLNYPDPPTSGVDYYTVILHEMTHAMGFATLIDVTGNSTSGNQSNLGPYLNFDNHLYDGGTNTKLLQTNGSFNTTNTNLVNSMRQGAINFMDPVKYPGRSFPIYSPGSWVDASLSHMDAPRTQYLDPFVMKHSIATMDARREWFMDELAILCILGYKFQGSASTAPYNCGLAPHGVADQISYSGNPLEVCINVLSNDQGVGTNGIEIDLAYGLKLLNPKKCRAEVRNNMVCVSYYPNQCGTASILYKPYDPVTKRSGNVTMITIVAPECPNDPDDPCNIVRNGDFEDGVTLEFFDQVPPFNDLNTDGNPPQPSRVEYWGGNDADLFIRGSLKNMRGQAVNSGWPDTHSTPNNDRYASFQRSEYIFADLYVNRPLVAASTYEISFYIRAMDACTLIVSATPTGPAINPTTINVGSSWTLVTFQVTGVATNRIYFRGDGTNTRYFIDDVIVRNRDYHFTFTKEVDNPNPKPGDQIEYKIIIKNDGLKDLHSVEIQDLMNTNIYDNITPIGITLDNQVPGRYFKTFSNLVAGQSETMRLQARVIPGTVCGIYQNCVEISNINDDQNNSIKNNSCPVLKACATINVRQTNGCICHVQSMATEETSICSSTSSLLLTPSASWSLPTSMTGTVSYVWTKPGGGTQSGQTLSLSGPNIPTGDYIVTVRILLTGTSTSCDIATQRFRVKPLETKLVGHLISERNCESHPSSLLSVPTPSGYTVIWTDEWGSSINPNSYILKNYDEIHAQLIRPDGCIGREDIYPVKTDCCLVDPGSNSFAKHLSSGAPNYISSHSSFMLSDGRSLIASGDVDGLNVLLLDKKGNTVWARNYQEDWYDIDIVKILEHAGDFYIICNSYYKIQNSPSLQYGRIMKIDNNGIFQWVNGIMDVEFKSGIISHDQSGNEDGLIIIGNTLPGANLNPPLYQSVGREIDFIRVTFAGVFMQHRALRINNSPQTPAYINMEEVNDVVEIRSDNTNHPPIGYIIVGRYAERQTYNGPVVGQQGMLAIRLNTAGLVVNQVVFRDQDEFPKQVIQTRTDNNVDIALLVIGHNGPAAFLKKMDLNLVALWSKFYSNVQENNYVPFAEEVIEKRNTSSQLVGYYVLCNTQTRKTVFETEIDGDIPPNGGLSRWYKNSTHWNRGFGNLSITPEGGLLIVSKSGNVATPGLDVNKTNSVGMTSCDNPSTQTSWPYPGLIYTPHIDNNVVLRNPVSVQWAESIPNIMVECCKDMNNYSSTELCEKLNFNKGFKIKVCHPNVILTPVVSEPGMVFNWYTPTLGTLGGDETLTYGFAQGTYQIYMTVAYQGCAKSYWGNFTYTPLTPQNLDLKICTPFQSNTKWWDPDTYFNGYDHYNIYKTTNGTHTLQYDSKAGYDYQNQHLDGHRKDPFSLGDTYTIDFFDADGCLVKRLQITVSNLAITDIPAGSNNDPVILRCPQTINLDNYAPPVCGGDNFYGRWVNAPNGSPVNTSQYISSSTTFYFECYDLMNCLRTTYPVSFNLVPTFETADVFVNCFIEPGCETKSIADAFGKCTGPFTIIKAQKIVFGGPVPPPQYLNTQNPTIYLCANEEYIFEFTDANGCVCTVHVFVHCQPVPRQEDGKNDPNTSTTDNNQNIPRNIVLNPEAVKNPQEVLIYPNPSKGVFNILCTLSTEAGAGSGSYGVTVCDLTGKIVYTRQGLAMNSIEQIDLSSYASGIYTVKATCGNKIYYCKIIRN